MSLSSFPTVRYFGSQKWSVAAFSAITALLFCVPLQAEGIVGDAVSAHVGSPVPNALGISPEMPNEIPATMTTAVALNYCRASFHRIRKDQSDEVLKEEQEKILNNLNLGQLNDPEVIALYTSVLDEIGQIGMADKERGIHRTNSTAQIRRQVTWDAVAFGTDLASAQFGNAVKTGANSWWDYRNQVYQRDVTLFRIDKDRHDAVVKRSNQFLDTFWNMARKKNIPDRWLVRGDDLDKLEAAMQEKDPSVRLRVLRRMEPYHQAYPPYWYYLARTHQELGQLSEAVELYERLERMGSGHFRKDELLSTALANMAAIQDHMGDARAVASARKALDYSTDVWEANLMSARILQRNGQIADAEDAILRNLDVELEQSQSHVFLASLYFFSHQDDKLVAMMNNPKAVAHLPAPVLLRCAAQVGMDKTPPLVINNILASLEAYPKSGFGSDQVTVRVGNVWQLHLARLEAFEAGTRLQDPQVLGGKGYHDLKFARQSDRGFTLASSSTPKELKLMLTYPDETVVHLTLNRSRGPTSERTGVFASTASNAMRITDVRIGDDAFALQPQTAQVPPESERLPARDREELRTPGNEVPPQARRVPNSASANQQLFERTQ